MKKIVVICIISLCLANAAQNNSQDDLYVKIIDFIKTNKTQFNEAVDLAMMKKFGKINGLYNKFCTQNSQICKAYDKENLGINPKREAEIFEKVCDNGKNQDCKILANAMKSFANGDNDMLLVVAIQSVSLLQKACDLKYKEACDTLYEIVK